MYACFKINMFKPTVIQPKTKMSTTYASLYCDGDLILRCAYNDIVVRNITQQIIKGHFESNTSSQRP